MSPLDFIPIHARQGGSGGPTTVGLFVTVGPCCSLASDRIIKPCPGLVTPMPSQNRRPCNPPPPTPASVLGCPSYISQHLATSLLPFPGKQHQNKTWRTGEEEGAWAYGKKSGTPGWERLGTVLEKEELKPLPFLPQYPGPADLSYREEGLVKEKSGSSLGMLAKVPHLGALKKCFWATGTVSAGALGPQRLWVR